MKNYKIKVDNKADSKEAQELFFELGYEWKYLNIGKVINKEFIVGFLYAEKDGCILTGDPDSTRYFDSCDNKELTIPQLRDIVVQSKNEQCLISGSDALRALADGKEVERKLGIGWCDDVKKLSAETILHGVSELRIKPRTITLNGIEIPAPFKPKAKELAFYITAFGNYDSLIFDWQLNDFGYWRTEQEIKQVVAALRSIFK